MQLSTLENVGSVKLLGSGSVLELASGGENYGSVLIEEATSELQITANVRSNTPFCHKGALLSSSGKIRVLQSGILSLEGIVVADGGQMLVESTGTVHFLSSYHLHDWSLVSFLFFSYYSFSK